MSIPTPDEYEAQLRASDESRRFLAKQKCRHSLPHPMRECDCGHFYVSCQPCPTCGPKEKP